MLRFYPNELIKEISLHPSLRLRYAITTMGRVISFRDKVEEGRILNGSTADGYRIIRYKIREEGIELSRHVFYYKLVAEYFLKKPSEDHVYVLHVDYNRANDDIKNLQWATREEMLDHSRKSPYVIQAKLNLIEFNKTLRVNKLTETKVILIKKMLANPNRKTRLKMIAKQFGVSETHIRRIERGDNWGHVKI